MNKYIANAGIKKLIELIFTELNKKQDKMDEITAEEVREMWDSIEITPAA